MSKESNEKIIAVVLLGVAVIIAYYQFGNKMFSSAPTVAAKTQADPILADDGFLDTHNNAFDHSDIHFVSARNFMYPPLEMAKLLWPEDYPEEEEEVEVVVTGEPPQLSVQAMIWQSRRPQAIVNDTIVNLGDTVEDAKIINISRTGVTFDFNGFVFMVGPQSPLTIPGEDKK